MSELVEQPVSFVGNASDESWVPKIDMVFESDEKAYQFYCLYGKEMGFGVRKHLVKRRSSGLVYSRVFSCYKEGFSRTAKQGKRARPDARSGCQAHMTVRIMNDGGFRVSEFEPKHNHELAANALTAVPEVADDSGTMPQAAHKNVGKQAIVRPSLRNYIPSKSFNAMKPGGTGAVMRYVQRSMQDGRSDSLSLCHPMGDAAVNESWVPKIGLEFEDDEAAYQFYINYAAGIGFSVRKHLVKRRASGIIYSRMYVCHKEGFRRKKDEQRGRCPKPYERTGCLASMTIKITKNGRYCVTEFEPKHNHALVIPSKAHLFRWRWRRGLIATQADLMDLAEELEASPKPSKEQMDEQDESCQNPAFLSSDYKNYIPSKRMNAMKLGDAGAVMQYVHEKQVADPSFYYALQLDCDDRVTNIFWADAKSMVDFEYFGDALCLDTTYKTSDYGRPFSHFIGVNHHKQAIIFGAAFLYDETEESFKWLFDTFKTAMSGKQPRLILTDRSGAMSSAIAAAWPGTTHRLCVWHMYNSATKHLNFVFQGSVTFARDFSKCLYDYEDEDEFLLGWKTMLENYDLHSNEWLAKLYEDREKWALAYGRQIFCADMKTALIKESMNNMLKELLDAERDLSDFFKHYDEIVFERRQAELQADIHARQNIQMTLSSRMLRQAANAYTPEVLKIFQREFELSMDCLVYACGQVETTFEFKVTVEDNPKQYTVRYDSSNGMVTCSCKKFEFVGIQCRHVLKTLDIINIKELPPGYILKRWTKDAKVANRRANHEVAIDGGTKSTHANRYSSLCCIFNKIAVRAAETVESYTFIESLSDQLMEQVYKILQTRPPQGLEAG
ncbi:protein FAR1-RELATED SEQUENCE 5 [Elaeis guineensis]|nr:protein FAR1-RELATED SEQUENCE 5 isoform X2 [Elaeis guineensis]XP_029122469.1 protein FAR1-RELATED SEQUENCE 5 isoform X2 [Elaeis guineensis]